MSQAPIDPINNQRELLDVSGQSIHFENRFHTLIYKGTVKNADPDDSQRYPDMPK